MILSNLNDVDTYLPLHPLFRTLVDYLRTHDLLHAPLGRITIDGDRLFINNINPDCKRADEQPMEGHKRYIDVHVLLEGQETYGVKPLGTSSDVVQPYDEATDMALYGDRPDNYITLRPGQLLILWPEDLHAPFIGTGKIRKLIAKVKI